jgi:hypothetical protein
MNWAAGSLALVTPFISLLRYYDYPIVRPESVGFVAFLAMLGLPLGWWLGDSSRRSRTIAYRSLAGHRTQASFPERQMQSNTARVGWSGFLQGD